jgi:hypothetical protein
MAYEQIQELTPISILLHGTAHFGRIGGYLLPASGFRSNNIQNFVLNQSDVVPKSLATLDLQSNKS